MLIKTRIFVGVGCATLSLTGCNSVPVGWGKSYETEFASSSSITIKYDPVISSMGEAQNAAQKHCDQYGKDAVPQAESRSSFGGVLKSASFVCVKRT